MLHVGSSRPDTTRQLGWADSRKARRLCAKPLAKKRITKQCAQKSTNSAKKDRSYPQFPRSSQQPRMPHLYLPPSHSQKMANARNSQRKPAGDGHRWPRPRPATHVLTCTALQHARRKACQAGVCRHCGAPLGWHTQAVPCGHTKIIAPRA